MSQLAYFNLPDVGEGLTEAEIVTWKVKVGDVVSVNQIIVEIETAKSLVELPCPFAGTVTQLMAGEGDTVNVGSPIIAVTVSEATSAVSAATSMHEIIASNAVVTEAIQTVSDVAASSVEEKPQPNLVGYGVSSAAPSRRRAAAGIAATQAVVSNAAPATDLIAVVPTTDAVLAKPPVRKLAKDMNVDISKVKPTGLSGEVTREDILAAAQVAGVFKNQTTPEPKTEREERIPVKGVRKAIASAMVQSAFTAPHVSIFVDVDATRTMEYVKRLKASADFAGVKVTPLLIMAKAMIWAVRRNPTVNSTWTDTEIIVHNYVNFGVAAATPRGLIVPNIKDADQLSMLELAMALEKLAATAREGRTTPQDMANGTITITNIGVFGVDTGTPILNPGEVGIVALGSIRPKPWVVDNEILVRQVTTIGATFDHRVVDGDVASRFVQDVASVIEEPALLLD
ncbi:MAG: 2-oxo acid dehydrogenase subunit E2 [Actinobacteria bacterium]|nr:2-oxo acid dehydrogenase subunit E2 [Actinomycetota bacterium]